jgi:Fic family protein
MADGDRHSIADQVELITDPDRLARQEVENGLRQYRVAVEMMRSHVQDVERQFRLRPSHLLRLNYEALAGIDRQAGVFRNAPVRISKSKHTPPNHVAVPGEVEALCDYVNDNWNAATPVHLCAYVLWRLNWIHPFVDGNGRTSRTAAYLVLNLMLNCILPGSPTIPEQISTFKGPYYSALESADDAWASKHEVDVGAMERIVEETLAKQLLSAARDASGELAAPSSSTSP